MQSFGALDGRAAPKACAAVTERVPHRAAMNILLDAESPGICTRYLPAL
jgi:hypothetical protein